MSKVKFDDLCDDDLPHNFMTLVSDNGGYFIGNISIETPQLPHVAHYQVDSIQRNTIKEFEENVVKPLNAYTSQLNKPLILLSKLSGVPRPTTIDEIVYDVDDLSDQMYVDKESLSLLLNKPLEEIEKLTNQRFRFPKDNWRSVVDEEFFYIGPDRYSSFVFSTYVDNFPNRLSLDFVKELLDDLTPEAPKFNLKGYSPKIADGGYILSMSKNGEMTPLTFINSDTLIGSDDSYSEDLLFELHRKIESLK